MASEASDILGARSLETGKIDDSGVFFKVTGIAALGLITWLAWFRGRIVFLKWKETRYKKAMRRRHGIPDEDERPFNVAYAAAVRAREREDQNGSAPGVRRSRNALAEGQQSLRQRFDDVAPQSGTTSPWQNINAPIVPQMAQAYAHTQQQHNVAQSDPLDFGSRYNPNPPTIHITEATNDVTSSRSALPSRQLGKQKFHNADHIRKRSFDDDEDEYEPTKKTRVEGEEFIDGDEDAAWAFKRGSKRGLAAEDDDEGYESTRGDKRPRNISRDQTPEDQSMEDGDPDADDVAELRSIPRGKKRDRAEAGSTFGGDDEADDHLEDKASRRRKRKMLSKRKSDAQPQARGKKRDRAFDAGESDDEEDIKRSRNSRKRKGKEADGKEETDSDVSMNESLISRSSYVKGRRIGEEWDVNGVLYKVGINGQRLRQALVKKARNKFPMPKDSQHPDREANMEVFVETWLTENEYKEAKDRHELAWQDTPKPPAEPETPGDVQDSPSIKGKNLLWASTAAQESPVPKRRPFRQSIATNLGLRINAFPEAQSAPGRRVASAYSPVPPSATGIESPMRKSGFRTFSKWEKQDLEAEAMAKMRAKLQEQKKTPSVGLGAPPLLASVSAPGLGSGALPSFTKSAEKPVPAPVTASFSLGSSSFTGGDTKPAETSKPSMLPPTSVPSSGESKIQPSMSFGKPPGAAPPSSVPLGSHPDLLKTSSTIPAASSTVPNFFGMKGDSSTPPSAPMSGNPLAPQSAAQPSTASKAPMDGFITPTSGFPSAPTATKPSISSTFSFGNKQTDKTSTSPFVTQPEQKKVESEKPGQGSEGGSLFSRLEGPSAPAPTAKPFLSTTPTGSPFSFGKTSSPNTEPAKPTSVFGSSSTASSALGPFGATGTSSKPTSVFGPSTTTGDVTKSTSPFSQPSVPQNTLATGSNGSATATKFNFGFSKNAAPSSVPGAPSGSTSEPSKSTASAFGFSAPNPATVSPAPVESSGATTAPKFKFTVPSAGSPFGSSNTPAFNGTPAATKSVFSGFTSNSPVASGPVASSPFSTTPAASPAPKSTFSFGGSSGNTSAASTTSKPAEAPKSSFSFGGNTTSTAPLTSSAQASPFSFAFSNAPSANNASGPSHLGIQPSTTPPANGEAQPVFGKTSTATPSAFGFGNNKSSSGTFGNFGGQTEQDKK